MTEVTLIGEHLAKKGLEFAFGGCLSRCQNCEIKNSCCGLEKNKWYKVENVRDKTHRCKVHHEDVVVVEVSQVPVKTVAPGRTAVEGSVITRDGIDCDKLNCENYRICNPPGVEADTKYSIEKVGKSIDCPKGKDLKLVELI